MRIIRIKTVKTMPKENYKEFLKSYGLKATPGRLLLLEHLIGFKKPMSIKEIAKAIGLKSMDQATIYRTLESFKMLGLVRQVDFHKDFAYYELADSDHHHLVCKNCGRVEDFEGCNIDTLSKSVLRKSKQFAFVDEHSLELFGLCKACAKIK